jgi:hypothetical protein
MPKLMLAKWLISSLARDSEETVARPDTVTWQHRAMKRMLQDLDSTDATASRRTVLHPSVRTLRPDSLTKRDAHGRC